MALVTGVFLDTSILLAGLIELGPASRPAQELMAAVAGGRLRRPCTAWHCCLEFYAVSTRLPEEFRLSTADAHRLIEEEVLTRFRVIQLPDAARKSFFQALAQERVIGGRVYDAHIGEIARRAGSKIVVTDNVRHFSSLLSRGVRVLDSATFANELGRR
ncbi:MAG: PIN domain-containing protein [Thermoanaerobaculia bacterium]